MFEGFESRRIEAGGPGIAISVGGKGPAVLLLHGYPQSKAMWGRIAPVLAQHFTVVAADLRGYGDSDKPQDAADHATYSFRAMADDQVAVMRALGFDTFDVIGHDRGGRVAHRLALDHPGRVSRLAVLDIVPTYAMFMDTNRQVAQAYWHWYFLAQPAPLPERLIGADPDFFFETCLVNWGKAAIGDFAPEPLAEYRRCWRSPEMIAASCADYRAAGSIDLAHDAADLDRKVECPSLVLRGAKGLMAQLFDMEAEWRKRLARMSVASLPGGHFFPDQLPEKTAAKLLQFLMSGS